jgi:hypothetical protein
VKVDDTKWPIKYGRWVRVEAIPGEVWYGRVENFDRPHHLHMRCPDGKLRAAWARWCREVDESLVREAEGR